MTNNNYKIDIASYFSTTLRPSSGRHNVRNTKWWATWEKNIKEL